MGRLIDADALIEVLRELKTLYGSPTTKRDEKMIHWVIGHINEQPTAYDVEKVVAELEEAIEDNEHVIRRLNGIIEKKKIISWKARVEAFKTAIDIVKRGWVE